MPEVFDAIAPDTLTILIDTISKDSSGRMVKSGTSNLAASVPCTYEPMPLNLGKHRQQGDRKTSVQQYLVSFPSHTSAGSRINLDPKTHRLVVAARGNEPVKNFRIVAVNDQQGTMFECICEREN